MLEEVVFVGDLGGFGFYLLGIGLFADLVFELLEVYGTAFFHFIIYSVRRKRVF